MECVSILLKTYDNTFSTMLKDLDYQTTVHDLKQQLPEHYRNFKLIFNGKILSDELRLSEYGFLVNTCNMVIMIFCVSEELRTVLYEFEMFLKDFKFDITEIKDRCHRMMNDSNRFIINRYIEIYELCLENFNYLYPYIRRYFVDLDIDTIALRNGEKLIACFFDIIKEHFLWLDTLIKTVVPNENTNSNYNIDLLKKYDDELMFLGNYCSVVVSSTILVMNDGIGQIETYMKEKNINDLFIIRILIETLEFYKSLDRRFVNFMDEIRIEILNKLTESQKDVVCSICDEYKLTMDVVLFAYVNANLEKEKTIELVNGILSGRIKLFIGIA